MNIPRRFRLILVAVIAFSCRQAADVTSAAPLQSAAPRVSEISAERRTPVVVAVHNVMPSVVNIQTESTIRERLVDPFFGDLGRDRAYKSQSVGSGFVWASDGIIVTNNHVVEGASQVLVNFSDKRQLPARVIGVDPDSDLAVLRVDAKNLTAASIGRSVDLLIGETVIAVGNPFGLSGSVTTGVVSATGRSVPSKEEGRTYTDFIQTDASINPGNSGGPLLNIEGKVIGINVAIYAQGQGIGFAIPVDRARKIVEDLRKFGEVHSAWIGAVTATITPEEARRLGLKSERGALVTRVFTGSPADRAGIRPGDVILSVGGQPIESREEFSTRTATATTGRSLSIEIRRQDSTTTINITPIDAPADLGARILAEISGLTVRDSGEGVQISEVRRGSRGESIGLEPGDTIVGVNGVEISSVKELFSQLQRSAERASAVLSVARGRYIYSLSFPLGQ